MLLHASLQMLPCSMVDGYLLKSGCSDVRSCDAAVQSIRNSVLCKPIDWNGPATRLYCAWQCTVSRGESGQQKQLLVLDDRFRQVDAVQLDIGPRHFAGDAIAPAAGVPPTLPADLRRGDR